MLSLVCFTMVAISFFEGTLSPAEDALVPSVALSQLAHPVYQPPADIDQLQGVELNERMFRDAELVSSKHSIQIVVNCYLYIIALHNDPRPLQGGDDLWWIRLCGMHADASFLKKLVFIVSAVLRDDATLLLQFLNPDSTFFPVSYLKQCTLHFVMQPNTVHDLFVAARKMRVNKGQQLTRAEFDSLRRAGVDRGQAPRSASPPPSEPVSRADTYYEVLAVRSDATEQQIKQAFRVMARKFHPDKNMGSESASETMKMLNEASTVLSDASSRRAYDLWLQRGKPSERVRSFHQHPSFAPGQEQKKRKQPNKPSSGKKPSAKKHRAAPPPPPPPPADDSSDEEDSACTVCEERTSMKDDHPVLICDGCNAEYHLRCTSPRLDAVPTGDWYCSRCAAQHTESSSSPSSAPVRMDHDESSPLPHSNTGDNNIASSCEEVADVEVETTPSLNTPTSGGVSESLGQTEVSREHHEDGVFGCSSTTSEQSSSLLSSPRAAPTPAAVATVGGAGGGGSGGAASCPASTSEEAAQPCSRTLEEEESSARSAPVPTTESHCARDEEDICADEWSLDASETSKRRCTSSCLQAHRDSYLRFVENGLLRTLVRDLQEALSEHPPRAEILQLDDMYHDDCPPSYLKCMF